jgi:hypothetical protein
MNETEIVKWSELVKFFPRQQEALNATKKFKYVLYGGSVGSGKSYFLRWAMIYWLCSWYAKLDLKGIRVGLFCEDYPALNDRHLSKIKTEFPDWLGSYNSQNHEFTLAPEYGSGVIAFRNLDDPSRYLSVEFAAEAVDEINRNPKPTFDILRTRLRWPGITDTKFVAACNPIGEPWVKNQWIKRLFPPEEREPQEYYFVKALPTDNPHLPAEYFASLESLPDTERKAYLEGDWNALDERMDKDGWMRLVTDTELTNSIVPASEHVGYRVLGVDPAAGGDNSAIVLKSGNLQEVLFNQKLNDVMDLCGVVADLYREHNIAMVVVDKTGLGEGVVSRLKQMDIPVQGISFGESPGNDMFQNLKAELYWKQRQWMLTGGRLIRNEGWNEFEVIKYKNTDKKIVIQPKEHLFKQGFKSPNCVDAAVLTHNVSDTTIRSARLLKSNQGQWRDKTIEIWRGN